MDNTTPTSDVIDAIPGITPDNDTEGKENKPVKKTRSRKAKADQAPAAATPAADRPFKTQEQINTAFQRLSTLLSDEQKVVLREERANVGGKMAAAFQLGIKPKVK